MKNFFIALIILILITVFSYTFISYIEPKKSKYDSIQMNTKDGVIKAISSYVVIPIIEHRIDFYLKNTGIITHLQKRKYDNKILAIQDIVEGTGKEALCGEEVVIDLMEITEGGMEKRIEDKKFRVGTDKIQALNISLIGMKEGGERSIIIPYFLSKRLIGQDNTSVMYKIKLKAIRSHHHKSVENLLIFDQVIGNKKAIMCGEQVSLNYILRDKKGNKITESSSDFQVGKGDVPLAFELGVIEMVPGSKRSIISPPELLSSQNGMFPKDEISIIDFNIN